ncbi:hypothetical protein [Paenarthrobacter sp. YJN-5]|uniref:hypothetical protein n=1 Tax=Paenarthrobacter sp. YJN-5 TaxID=2735316 RepID=UPI00187854EF|nr:hypothetical protein [Paenarthrobacter sp. YJN-5]QOT19622.1 hypothetical protein HMI59_23695 [Paenarthrobacter sp. YJN-5]
MTEPDELIDDDGYPTDEALNHLRTFNGTAEEMVAYVRSLMHNGRSMLEDYTNDYGRPEKRLTLITGGWSGCESVIGTLSETMFHLMFWESSHRGGKHTFNFSQAQWEMSLHWGIAAPPAPAQTS